MADRLSRLWQKGIVDAEWDADAEATEWHVSDFGVQLYRQYGKAGVEQYIRGTAHTTDETPSAVEVLQDAK